MGQALVCAAPKPCKAGKAKHSRKAAKLVDVIEAENEGEKDVPAPKAAPRTTRVINIIDAVLRAAAPVAAVAIVVAAHLRRRG